MSLSSGVCSFIPEYRLCRKDAFAEEFARGDLAHVQLLVSLDELDTFGMTVESALLGAVSANARSSSRSSC